VVQPYQDPTNSMENRVEDLLARLTLEDKAGLMFHDIVMMGPGGQLMGPDNPFGRPATEAALRDMRLNHFNLAGPVESVRSLIGWHNQVQEIALATGLGIPVTLSTDPRHSFSNNPGTEALAGAFSQWPQSLGFAAMGDADLVQRYADIARQEYLAAGIRVALHPQIDLATEPRWARIGMTFGEDADLTSRLVTAYIRGFQGADLGPASVATMTKHFPGGGPQADGEDPHFAYGREQVYPGGQMDYHLIPFRAAIAAGTSQIMPYYGMPVGTDWEEVGFAFSKKVITDLLRNELGFDGIVCTDWGLISDSVIMGQPMPARAWGVEHLSELERAQKVIDAGCDQFGGESRPELVVELVRSGRVSEARIDQSARRLLREKFVLGLFDQPVLDVGRAVATIGREDFVAEGEAAQRAAIAWLTAADSGPAALPLGTDHAIYTETSARGPRPGWAAWSTTLSTRTWPCCGSMRPMNLGPADLSRSSMPARWSFRPWSATGSSPSASKCRQSSCSSWTARRSCRRSPTPRPPCWSSSGPKTTPSSTSCSVKRTRGDGCRSTFRRP
jgi:beta-glucosidase